MILGHKDYCFYCGDSLYDKKHDVSTGWQGYRNIDHMIPVSRGGRELKNNRVYCCRRCNSDKGMLTITEYRIVIAYRKGYINFNSINRKILFAGELESFGGKPVESL